MPAPGPISIRVMEKARGIVIRITRLSDTSLIVHWCTEEIGLLKTVAKGARRPRSPFAGKLDLFVEADLVWVPSRKSELHILKEVEVADFHAEIRRGYTETMLASYFGQLLEKMVEREHPVPELFDLLRRALGYLVKFPADRRALLHYERQLAELLGVGHEGLNAGAALERACGGLPRARMECLSLFGKDPETG
ncbi:MAG: DNA repair protein RecO [Roseibacillus sp.]|nr:DNA repair protein RecO [Roseibacillus sp.]